MQDNPEGLIRRADGCPTLHFVHGCSRSYLHHPDKDGAVGSGRARPFLGERFGRPREWEQDHEISVMNQRSSRMWHLPEIVRLMNSKHAAFATGDFLSMRYRVEEAHGIPVHALLALYSREALG